jgi:tetratricopeptide (TPR) repeat protein
MDRMSRATLRTYYIALAILLFLSVVHFKHVPPSAEGAPGGLEVSVGVDGMVSPILAVLFLLPYLLSSLEEFVIGPSGISGKLRTPEILGQAHSTHPGKAVEAVEGHTLLKAMPSVPAAVAEALPTEPDDIRTGYTLKDLAQFYLNQGRREDALQTLGRAKDIFENVLKQDPDNASAYNGLGNIYYLQGEYEKAVGQYQEALGRAPDYAAAYNDMALACEALMIQDKEKSEYWKQKAAEHWETFLQLAQDNPQFPPDYVRGARRRYRALRGR